MHYASLSLKNYRSYSNLSVEFSDGVNIVVGPNASGKTNLLESILVASGGSSYRGNDRALIKFDRKATKITAITNTSQERVVTIKIIDDQKTQKQIRINGVPHKRLGTQHTIPTVLFEPEHLRMVHGSPETRREYLDAILSITQADYKTTLNRYKKALAQRNRLLKSEHRLSRDDVFVWDVQLSEYGSRIHMERSRLVETLNNEASSTYSAVSGKKTKFSATYADGEQQKDYASRLLKELENRFVVDRQRGFTTRGPHREDLTFFINDKNANMSASRGEARTIVLVCKILEMQLLEESTEHKPIILLDDVFSELDGSRRLALADFLKNHQTIITTTDADAIIRNFLSNYNVIATS